MKLTSIAFLLLTIAMPTMAEKVSVNTKGTVTLTTLSAQSYSLVILYRLVSPYDNQGLSSIMYVSEAKDKAVFYWWKIANFYNVHLPLVKMAGLDANKMYKVRELDVIDNKPLDCEGKSYSGKYLMEHGLEMPYTNEVDWGKKTDWSSRVLYLEAQ